MIQGAILEKGEPYYTRFGKIFHTLHNFQTEYNWLITDCVAYPQNERTAAGIEQAAHGSYNWFRGDELTELLEAEELVKKFRQTFPLSEDLAVHNARLAQHGCHPPCM